MQLIFYLAMISDACIVRWLGCQRRRSSYMCGIRASILMVLLDLTVLPVELNIVREDITLYFNNWVFVGEYIVSLF